MSATGTLGPYSLPKVATKANSYWECIHDNTQMLRRDADSK